MNQIKIIFFKNKKLFENFFSLSILQVVHYIIPIITLPFLFRVLGPEKVGTIFFAQSLCNYFILFTEYGFKLSASRNISINKKNNKKISDIFCSTYIIKLFLFFISLLIFSMIVFGIKRFNSEYLVYLFSFIMVFANLLNPSWIFQGMEKLKKITIINIVISFIFILPIFLMIKSESDYIYVPLINSTSQLIFGFISFYIAIKKFRINITIPEKKHIFQEFKDGWFIFVSLMATSLYTNSTVFILGLLTNNLIVGYYTAAEKIIKAVRGLLSPLSQTTYPHLSQMVLSSKRKAFHFIKKMLIVVGSTNLLISILIFSFSRNIIEIFFGQGYTDSVQVLKNLSFLPFIVSLSNVFGIQTMLTLNFKREFFKILTTSAVMGLFLSFILSSLYQHIGMSIAVVLTELIITVAMFLFLNKKGVFLKK